MMVTTSCLATGSSELHLNLQFLGFLGGQGLDSGVVLLLLLLTALLLFVG